MDRINQSLDLLQTAQQSVLLRLDIWLASRHRHGITQALQTLRSNAVVQMQNIALHSIPAKKFSKALAYMMHKSLCSWLLSSTPNDMIAERIATIELLTNLQVAGFGDELGQRVFAQVMNGVIDSFVQSATMKVDWMQRESIVDRLRQWVERSFIPAVTDGLRSLTGDTSFRVALNESSEWQSAALDRLAKQRIKFLLDYVKAWPHSTGAILDLKVGDYQDIPSVSVLSMILGVYAFLGRQDSPGKFVLSTTQPSSPACGCDDLRALEYLH